MGGNPLVLAFLILGVLLLVAVGVLAYLQRKMFAQHKEQVTELLEEARKIAEEGGFEDVGEDGEGDG